MATRSATVAAKLAAHSSAKEELSDLTSSFTSLMVEEKEKTKEAIQEVEAEIRFSELEAKLQYLKEEWDRVRGGRALTNKEAVPQARTSTPVPEATFRGHPDEGACLNLPPPSWRHANDRQEGFTDYGWSIDGRHNRSRSRSDSSETRRRRSK